MTAQFAWLLASQSVAPERAVRAARPSAEDGSARRAHRGDLRSFQSAVATGPRAVRPLTRSTQMRGKDATGIGTTWSSTGDDLTAGHYVVLSFRGNIEGEDPRDDGSSEGPTPKE